MKRIVLLLSAIIFVTTSINADEANPTASESGIKYGYDLFMLGAGAVVVGAVAAAILETHVVKEVADSN